MVVLARLSFCWNPGGATGRIRFPAKLPPRLIHKNGGSHDKQGMVDKEELWREAEQCLAQLSSKSRWSSALFNPTRSDLTFTLRPDLESDPSSELEALKRLQDLLAANPWLRQRRRFASKAVGVLARLESNCSREKEIALSCKELRLKFGDLPLPRGAGPRVLALDGGGMRGLVTLVMLQELEQRTGRRIHELFDLVVGTSTGAIVAAIVCVRGLGAKQALDIYRELGSQVFQQSILRGAQGLLSKQSYYSNHQLDVVLFRHFGAITLESTLMVNSVPLLAFVATDVTRLKLAPHLFCNYPYPPGQQSLHGTSTSAELVTALLASSAAPGYFPAVQVGGRTLQDGAIVANNPASLALLECRQLWPSYPLHCLVSLGSGKSTALEEEGDGKAPSAKEFGIKAVNAIVDTEPTHHLLNELIPDNSYFRLNPRLASLPDIDQVDPEALDRMMEGTRQYLRRNTVKLDRLVARLLKPRSMWESLLVRGEEFKRKWTM